MWIKWVWEKGGVRSPFQREVGVRSKWEPKETPTLAQLKLDYIERGWQRDERQSQEPACHFPCYISKPALASRLLGPYSHVLVMHFKVCTASWPFSLLT